jgi:N6-L-threonylcarbamoyladenine synthase
VSENGEQNREAVASPSMAEDMREARQGVLAWVGSIDAVVATTRPGLRPALVVGETAGRALAAAWGKPFVPVHHIAGHIAASWLQSGGREKGVGKRELRHEFPAVVLVVSGGHTQLFRLNEKLELKTLGQTRDDAAGEAFDKIARLLELPYPGGPELAKLAENGDEKAFDFPRPMLNSDDLDFSFSGLKTAVYYAIRDKKLSEVEKANVAASAQNAIVDLLVQKTLKAVKQEGAQEVIIAGGVAANTKLRETMKIVLEGTPLIVPSIKYCTDNAAMIGAAALLGIEMPTRE